MPILENCLNRVAVISPKFEHVILTRFNVRWEDDPDAPSVGLNLEWLSNRFALFERYCLPSMLAQTERNYKWLLFFNEKTPDAYADRIRALNREHPFIVPVFCGALPLTDVQRAVRDVVQDGTQWLLTSRLDNDDGLHPRFVARVQQAQGFEQAEVLNFPYGVIFRAGHAYRRRDLSNAFISLSEPMSDGRTVFGIERHVYASDFYPVRQLADEPMWLQVIHQSNVSNRVRGLRIPASSVEGDFPSIRRPAGAPGERKISVILENSTLYIVRSASDWLVMIARRVAKMFGVDLHRKAVHPRTRQTSP